MIGQIPLAELERDSELAAAFDALHEADWYAAGIRRWRALLRPDGPWPIVVLADRSETGALTGAINGVWAPEPVSRFDDLLDQTCPTGARGNDLPSGGYWHFFALTVAAGGRGQGQQQALVHAGLAWVLANSPEAGIRTLSPARLLPELSALIPADWLPEGAGFKERARAVIDHVCEANGRPALPILRLHPANGATLDAVLFDSRRDEVRSGGVTLRFAYAADSAMRAARQADYLARVESRLGAVIHGRARGPLLFEGRPLWWVDAG